MALLSLPVEVLREILNNLPNSSLSSFCQASKHAKIVAEPLLYRHLEWTFDQDDNNEGEPADQPADKLTHSLHLFFRTIFYRPTLAEHVKTAVLLSGAPPPAWAVRLPECPAPTDIWLKWLEYFDAEVQPLLDNPDDDDEASHRNEVESGNPGALIATLLVALPNLSTLTVDYTLAQQSRLPNTILKKSLPALKSLAVLNNLDSRLISPMPPQYPTLTAIFSLPFLTYLSAPLQCVKSTSPALISASLPDLKTLDITEHIADSSAITHLISRTPKLEKLNVFLVEDMDTLVADANGFHVESHAGMWKALASALASVSGTLKTLKISVDLAATNLHVQYILDEDWVFGISERRGGLGTLVGLERLTKLEMPMYLLFGRSAGGEVKLREMLPRGLRVLTLRDDYVFDEDLGNCSPEAVVPILEGYLEDCGGLKELRLKLRLRGLAQQGDDGPGISGVYNFLYGQSLRRLGRMGWKAGVKVVVYVKESSCLSAEKGCLDVYNQLVVFDPSDPDRVDLGDEGRKSAAEFSKGMVCKSARCFISNWEW